MLRSKAGICIAWQAEGWKVCGEPMVRAGKLFLMSVIAVLALSGALSQSAYAWPHKHHKFHAAKTPKYHYKPDKNAYLFGGQYKTPKKQKYKEGSFHNTGTGDTVSTKK